MEPFTPSKRLMLIAAAVTLSTVAGTLAYRQLSHTPLNRMIRADLPMLELNVKLLDQDDEILDAADSPIASTGEIPAGDEHCPALKGGDIASPSVASSDQQRPSDCPRQAVWFVNKRPVAMTLHFNDGEGFLKWWDGQPQIQSLLAHRFTQGLFSGLLQSLKIKAEQLKLQGLQGEFLSHVLRDAVAANAELHYDMAHGHRGWVLSYPRGGTFAEQALPAVAGLLAGSGYRIAKLPEPILEMRIGTQQFFVTEYRQRLYLAQSLEALLNVIESIPPSNRANTAPLSLTFRAEAFIAKLLPALAGTPSWEARFDFDLTDGKLGTLALPAGPWTRPLHDNIFEGVLASIPHDTFAAVATSLPLPPTLTVDDWRQFAANGPTPATAGQAGGLAFIWDFDADNAAGAIGVVIANPDAPQASPAYVQYLKNPELGAECGGGTVFLAASSQSLLTRMRDACARQSLSPLDWQRGAEKARYLSSQLVAFVNPGAGIRELFMAGGAGNAEDAGEFAPRWKQDYELAKTAMRQDGDKLFSGLPIFSYAGRIAKDGPINLEGRLVAQEIMQ